MGNRRVIEVYYRDTNNLVDILGKLVSSYRLLIGGADELNKIALSKKGDIKDALERADKVGDIIDEIIKTLEKCNYNCSNYCELKSDILKNKIDKNNIYAEILEEFNFKE